MEKIRVGIVGYGNLGRGVEMALRQQPDMEPAAILTRRPPDSLTPITPGLRVLPLEAAEELLGLADVMILCGGSATDLPVQGPLLAANFNTVDSFDTHARIPDYFASMDAAARDSGRLSIISVGWDPGLFSLNRLYGRCVLPVGADYTFWGRGVSQGHSDAIRRIPGVLDARQYTVPVPEAVEAVKRGETPELTPRQKHTRECYVAAAEDADKTAIEKAIREMPNYFADYDTTVHFISLAELREQHGGMPHGGFVIRTGETADGSKHTVSYSLKLESNPAFTSSVLTAYARAAYRLAEKGESGARTVLDVPPALLSAQLPEALRRELL